jgi:uncharacterized protein YtpQ (UPF0354 family)
MRSRNRIFSAVVAAAIVISTLPTAVTKILPAPGDKSCGDGRVVSRLMVFVLATAMMFAGGLAPAAAAENLSPRAFTDAAAAAARAAMPSAQVTVSGDLHLETRGPSGKGVSTDLTNAYDVYLRSPEHLDDVIRRYVNLLVETVRLGDAKPALDRSRIVPVLKPQRWVDGVRQVQKAQKPKEPPPEILTEPFNTELAIVYAEDRPSSMRFLTTGDDVGDRARLHNLALANLHRLLPKIEMHDGADGISLISAGGDYDASLLLADGIWSSGQIKVDGDIVVAVPGRDALFVTGSHNRTGIARLRAMAAELATGPYALTSALFVYRNGKFVKFEAD